MAHKGCSLVEVPMSFHWFLWHFASTNNFVRCEHLGRQRVCLSALSHGVGQGCECILAKPGSHQQWASGAAKSPKVPLAVCQLPKKAPSLLHVIHYPSIWMDSRVDSPAVSPAVLAARESCDRDCPLGWVTAAWWHWNRSSWHAGDLSISEHTAKCLLNQ